MTFLPIVERELRVRSRRGATYWSRGALVLMSIVLSLQVFWWSSGSANVGAAGKSAFTALAGMALVFAVASVLLTADCISSERREGTLGLLFLTPLKAYDIVLGKLSAAGLGAMYALLGFVPALAIPLVAGGVTGGEMARTAAVLCNVLFVSLAAGMWVSTWKLDQVKVTAWALALAAVVLVLPAAIGALFQLVHVGISGAIADLSLLTAFFLAQDVQYRAMPERFWLSLAAGHCEAWLLLWAASRTVSRTWREQRLVEGVDSASGLLSPGGRARRRGRGALIESDPVSWLAARLAGRRALIRTAITLMGLNIISSVTSGWLPWVVFRFRATSTLAWLGGVQALGSMASLGAGAMLAWAVGRFFFQSRRTGVLELLLVSPLDARSVVAGQWRALKRLLRWPVILLAALYALASLPWSLTGPPASAAAIYYWEQLFYAAMRAANLVLYVLALCWIGMWFGMIMRRPAAAVVWTIGLVDGVSWLGSYLQFSLMHWLWSGMVRPGVAAYFFWRYGWLSVGVLYNLLLIAWARHLLRTEFRRAAAESMTVGQSFSAGLRWLAGIVRAARRWPA